MTQDEFDKLPLLLKPQHVMRALGVSWDQLQALPLSKYVPPPVPGRRRRYARYYRAEVARMVRLRA